MGAIYTKSDQTVYSYRLSIQNATFYDFKLIGKKKLNDTVESIHAIKQKGQNKIVIFYPETQHVHIFDDKLKTREASVSIKKQQKSEDVKIKDILVQPMSLLLVQDHSIDIFKLTSNTVTAKNQSCHSDLPIEHVKFDTNSPNIILASSQNIVTIFEARGKGINFQCKNRGSIKFEKHVKSIEF